MESVRVLCLCLLSWSGLTFGDGNEPLVFTVEKGGEVILPCSVNTDIEKSVFDWKKDGQKEVFYYDAGVHYNNGRTGQDEQFKGRVSHFQDELRHGNTSIKIRNTKIEDSGVYTCIFPRLQPRQTFSMKLVVGAAPKPTINRLNETKYWSQLQCEARGNPEPTVQWQDSAGNNLTAEVRQNTKRGDDFYVTVNITVSKSDRYSCVVTQETICHQISAQTDVYVDGDSSYKVHIGWIVFAVFSGAIILAVVQFVLIKKKIITLNRNKGSGQQRNDVEEKNPTEEDSLKV